MRLRICRSRTDSQCRQAELQTVGTQIREISHATIKCGRKLEATEFRLFGRDNRHGRPLGVVGTEGKAVEGSKLSSLRKFERYVRLGGIKTLHGTIKHSDFWEALPAVVDYVNSRSDLTVQVLQESWSWCDLQEIGILSDRFRPYPTTENKSRLSIPRNHAHGLHNM